MQSQRKLVSLIPGTGLWHFILEVEKYTSTENIMIAMEKQWLQRAKIDSPGIEGPCRLMQHRFYF